ncbi:hypothetical protein KIPB_014542, partial [Kipferlia bialata]|eukprot:g14542.t1
MEGTCAICQTGHVPSPLYTPDPKAIRTVKEGLHWLLDLPEAAKTDAERQEALVEMKTQLPKRAPALLEACVAVGPRAMVSCGAYAQICSLLRVYGRVPGIGAFCTE